TDLLRISTQSKVSLADWEKVYAASSQLISSARCELDALDQDSQVSKLNDSKVGMPVSISPLALDYLDTNLSHYLSSEGKFNPFKVRHAPKLIEVEDQAVTKLVEFVLGNTLLTSYIIDTLDELLRGTGISSYLISTPQIYVGRGDVDWQVEFEHPLGSENVEAAIRNSSIQMATRDNSHKMITHRQKSIVRNPFANEDVAPSVLGLILQHNDSQTQARVITELAMGKSHTLEVKPILQEIALSAWVLNPSGEFVQLLPAAEAG
ncbi:hypothetical protein KC640_03455, partial [Candidatus Dojkabacteria bacterium]|nr:hypothetical protein [Candidatus Dojkabacteria bacterium]